MYYDTKLAILYNIKYKNGSSLLHDIYVSKRSKKTGNGLKKIDLAQFIEIYQKQPGVKIVTTIRNPKDAYFSGYNQILHQDWMQEDLKLRVATHKNNIMHHYSAQLKKWTDKWETELPSYDFNDGHCAHYLWLTLSLIAGGCNLSIIKLEDYTEYLLSCYPECSDLILTADADAHGKNNIVKDLSLQAFNNSVLAPQHGSKNENTWRNWMSLEVVAFDSIIKFLKNGKKQQVLTVLNKIAESDVYWKCQPSMWTIMHIKQYVKMIGKHNLPFSIVTRADTI
tara:strand:- start:1323 stop:2165 length:843 start_codon:yes stop_codon:yes gene_type:complete